MDNPFIIQEKEDSASELERKYRKYEIEGTAPKINLPDQEMDFSEDTEKKRGIFYFWAIILFFFLLFLGRGAYLQIFKGEAFLEASREGRLKKQIIAAPRGRILDRNGKILVDNSPSFTLNITPAVFFEDKKKELENISILADILGEQEEGIKEEFSRLPRFFPQPIVFKEALTLNQAIAVETVKDTLSGVSLEVVASRKYSLENESFGHVLGYLGKISPDGLKNLKDKGYASSDLIGKAGVEVFFEEQLRGKPETVILEVNAQGQEVRRLLSAPRQKGNDIVLTINADLMEKLEESLKKSLQVIGKQKAAAIALDPRNGEILALVSLPGFQSEDFNIGKDPKQIEKLLSDPNQPLFPRAISGVYPSGSVIKPIIALAGLQEGIMTPYTRFRSTGGIRIGQSFFPDWKPDGHGLVNLADALAWSVNTYFYIIGGGYSLDWTKSIPMISGLGFENIAKYFQIFKLGQKEGIDLPGEATGFFPTPEEIEKSGEHWYIGDTYNLSIGQGKLAVTPLQIALMTSVFANGGTLYKPHVLRDSDPEVLEQNIGSLNNIEAVRHGLLQAVERGSARRLKSFSVSIAGKTGTAQWQKEESPHSWFTGFAPYVPAGHLPKGDENPEIVLTVLVEEGGEGSGVALDVAKSFFEWYFK